MCSASSGPWGPTGNMATKGKTTLAFQVRFLEMADCALNRDFLFGRPRTVVGVSGGWLAASQAGGIFDFTREVLTVNEGDFDTAALRFDAGRAVSPRLDVVAEVGFSRASVASEYRDFVDLDDLPIVQTTELTQVPVGGSLRFWLTPRGREVGRLAWVPNRIAPYVGAGGGARWYRFTQFGDFVDSVDLSIFTDRLESSGWTASGHVFAGASFSLTRHLFPRRRGAVCLGRHTALWRLRRI